ncbi:Abortive infection protein [Thermoproteus uzoniensis 768-20]|uniref:Abortive infection protein n=1 Tax=Thermoproteus uzoniensis (strain 768-20) TaxID=999630 RepID=F2L693_THEU7|nr:CPBP family intramembrane glutamic endopeptidase [Thermoproteus uzoniensis]AEA12489.1 Abortive infection protein [Thermoproteus uzoniensis 768-20]
MNRDVVYVALPALLWPLTFDILRSQFLYAMAASTAVLAALTLLWRRGDVAWLRARAPVALAAGVAASAALYFVFVAGHLAMASLGLGSSVTSVYRMLTSAPPLVLAVAVVPIGVFEEIYWRGGLQGLFKARDYPGWALSAVYYTAVHISTLNPALVAGALVIGLVDGLLAERLGLAASTAAHVIWLELVAFFPP